MNHGFIKLQRSDETLELLRDPNAFVLLTVIALRARRTDEFNIHHLKSGEALLGDYRKYGMTEQQYRCAKKRLARYRLATFRPIPRGTIARLAVDKVYDINEESGQDTDDGPMTDERRTSDEHVTTNKNEKNEKKEKKDLHSDEWRLSELFLESILERKRDFRQPDLSRWAAQMERMIRQDGRTPERIEAVIRWCRTDPFWSNNILSVAKLRQHFDRLELEMTRLPAPAAHESTREMVERMEREGTL